MCLFVIQKILPSVYLQVKPLTQTLQYPALRLKELKILKKDFVIAILRSIVTDSAVVWIIVSDFKYFKKFEQTS